ncbi:thiocillin family RiPP [Viridibacillus sp. NPDC093762]
MNNFNEIKVEEMSLYIDEQDQELSEVAGTWGSASTLGSCASTISTAG